MTWEVNTKFFTLSSCYYDLFLKTVERIDELTGDLSFASWLVRLEHPQLKNLHFCRIVTKTLFFLISRIGFNEFTHLSPRKYLKEKSCNKTKFPLVFSYYGPV